jgi:2',3'-cyclic-nucleotide 2'-phosphodiesterase (5'-nucleotidase family)
MRLSLFILSLVLALPSWAARLQILHINDLHSHFEGGDGIGGYAKLATKLSELKAAARAQGMETLILDAGDFGEGSSFFFADEGRTALRMMDDLGIDVTVIGNHDLLQGAETLARLFRETRLKTQVTTANLEDKFLNNQQSIVKPIVVKTIAGVKIGIVGLTTAEPHYQYAIKETGKVRNPIREVPRVERLAKDVGVDYLIALTHIGSENDVKLVQASRSIDLVVGGHSHERLEKPIEARNFWFKKVPVVQAGAHAMAVGQLIVEIDPASKKKQLISSRVILLNGAIAKNAAVEQKVQQAKRDRETYFGRRWNEPIGHSLIPLTGHVNGRTALKATCWGQHLAVMVRDASGADVGIHASGFTGETIAPGAITFGDLIDNFPHFRRFGDEGWTIGVAILPKVVVKSVNAFVSRVNVGLNIAMPEGDHEGGSLKVAYPTEIAYALEQSVPMLKGLLTRYTRDTGIPYWDAMEAHVKRFSPLSCLAQ